MDVIKYANIENALVTNGRTYLCGKLNSPNGLEHIQTDGYEIGMSYYPDFSSDSPHLHTFNMEYNYILEGELKILLLNENKEIHLKKGDLFVIHPNEPYIGKALPETRTLFSKVPGGNDKVTLPISETIKEWSSNWNA